MSSWLLHNVNEILFYQLPIFDCIVALEKVFSDYQMITSLVHTSTREGMQSRQSIGWVVLH